MTDREPHQDTAPLAFLDDYLREVIRVAREHLNDEELWDVWWKLDQAAESLITGGRE